MWKMVLTDAATPAYIPVQARRSLAPTAKPTPASSQTTTPEAPRKRVEWPPEVRLYVQRSFAPENQIQSVSREELETRLRKLITEATENGRLYAIKWETLPLPQVMIQNDRNQVLTNPSVSDRGEETSRKRKSTEYTPGKADSTPPWRQTNHDTKFEDRVTYSATDKRQRIEHKNPSKSKANLEMRRRRFEEPRSRYGSSPSSPRGESPATSVQHEGPIVGRSQELEKNYFRLTSAPNPDTVRPLPVLQQTLDLLKKKWKRDNNYGYICDQFKSLRQDLTVQRIRNEFTVNVYEIHARIALEKGDLGEYNQCQTQLRALYTQQLGGHPTEFKAYRILYFIHTRNWTAMNDALADLSAADKRDAAVKHALEVRSALALGNYHKFFQLYLDTPNMGAYLMDMFVDRERLSALTAICKA